MHFDYTDLRHIRHAVTLGNLLSFSKAAKELGISQPALSRSIQAMEERAQVRLFDRDRGRVRVTEVGRRYLGRAQSVLREVGDLEQMLHRSAKAELGEVTFGASPLPARALMPIILTSNVNSRPDMRSHVIIRTPDALLEQLRSGRIEFCICPEQHVPLEDMRAMVLGRFPISLLVRTGHPLLQQGAEPRPGQFPIVLASNFSPTGGLPKFFQPLFSNSPNIIIDDFGVLAQVTASTDSIWLSSAFAAYDHLRRGQLKELMMPDGSRLGWFRVVMYSLTRQSLSPGAILLHDLFMEELRALANELKRSDSAQDISQDSP